MSVTPATSDPDGAQGFTTEVTLSGPWRHPRQMLDAQVIRGAKSLHDDDVAAALNFSGAPIEAPTHFSQVDPLAYLVWGDDWFERGCVSCHFQTMVIDGEPVCATLTTGGPTRARISASKEDGTPVFIGTASIGPNHPASELDTRLTTNVGDERLFIVDQLHVGLTSPVFRCSIEPDVSNGPLYPFTLNDKLERITEPHPWYTQDGGAGSPWGRAILPMEMVSVLAHKSDVAWPIRTPSVGLFLDLEIRLLAGPVFVATQYDISSEVVALGQSRRTESYWTRTTIRDVATNEPVASVLLHAGVLKDSFPGYPR